MLLLLTAQAATAAPPETIDLLVRPEPSCAATKANEVVVCGRRDADRYRIPPDYRTPTDKAALGRAETRIGNALIAAQTERVQVGEFPSNRIHAAHQGAVLSGKLARAAALP